MDAGAAGKTFPSYEFHVERGKIREFADAIGDPNPIYRDPDYAAEMGFAGILAPPTMLRTFLYEPKAASEALKVKDWSYIVHGEQEFEYFAPIVAGDVLIAQERALDGIRAGLSGVDADALARSVIDESRFAGTMGHGLGHGLGLDVHEAPRLSAEVYERIADINAKGVTVLLVEQNTVLALEVAQRAYVIENGHIVLDGPARELARHPRVREAYLGA